MSANKKNAILVNHESLKELIDAFFPNSAYSPIEEQLWNWFAFALSEKGITIKDLQADEFTQFSEQLTQLIAAVYQWAKLHKPSARQ
jgi:hypothetical protein